MPNQGHRLSQLHHKPGLIQPLLRCKTNCATYGNNLVARGRFPTTPNYCVARLRMPAPRLSAADWVDFSKINCSRRDQ